MKKKLSFLLAIVMVLSLTTTALATEVPISSIESMRTYLTEVGVEEEFINTVSDEMITSLYDEMSSGRAEVESYSVAYGNIGGQEVSAVMSQAGAIPAADMSLHCLTTRVSSGGGKIEKYRVWVSYKWLDSNKTSQTKNPFWRLTQDGIIVNWDSTYLTFESGSMWYQGYFTNPLNPDKKIAYGERLTKSRENAQGGLGILFDLHRDGYMYLSGEMHIALIPKTGAAGSGATNINANYAHTYAAASALNILVVPPYVQFTCSLSYKTMGASTVVNL